MRLKTDNTEQKLRGGYYTPKKLSNFIIDLFKDDLDINTILEPSCGDGVFLESIFQRMNHSKIDKVKAIEIIKEEADKVNSKYKENKALEVVNGDFILLYNELNSKERYDLIVGNPPYIRYQYLTERQRELQSEILVSHNMKSNKLINAWVCFLVACVQLLSENGKIAFVIPAEILQVAYAEDLRLFLSNNLSKIALITFDELVFDNIEQEVVVLIGEKDSKVPTDKSMIGIKEFKNLDDLSNFTLEDLEYQLIEHTQEKWTKYFLTDRENKLIEKIQQERKFVKFQDLGIINVGITTGNNKYFSVNKETVNKFELNNVILPLIGRSSHAHGIYFIKEDWEKNISKDANAYLIHFPDTPYEEYPTKHKEYIELGEASGENKGYKCSIRDKWYIVPSVWIPDAFFLRRNNTFPKFVLNNIDAVSTDTMHRIKFNEGIDRDKVLLSYYNSITFAFTEINGRSYGGGVLEILPGEVGKILLPNLQEFDDKEAKELINKIDHCIRNNKNIEDILDEIDEKVLVNFIGLDKEICEVFRQIWKKMMKRRHGRSR